MKYDSTAFRILRMFALNPGLHRAKTIGDIAIAINATPGTAVYQRMKCDLMPKWVIVGPTDDNTYWMPVHEARRALREVKRITREHFAALRAREVQVAA